MKERQLSDTVENMLSSNYASRFRAEYEQLKIRLDKLYSMLAAWDFDNLDFEPACPRSTYNLQVRAMENYLSVLETRAHIEQISL
jgi:hypothetical protein